MERIYSNSIKMMEEQNKMLAKYLEDGKDYKSMDEVYADIMVSGLRYVNSMGVYKEYIRIENQELSSPRGRIEIQKTVQKQSMLRGKLVCSYTELTVNNRLNQVILATLKELDGKDIREEYRNNIKSVEKSLNGTDKIRFQDITLKDLATNSVTIKYKPMLFITKELMNERKNSKKMEYGDREKIYQMFKVYVSRYLRKLSEEANLKFSTVYYDLIGETVEKIERVNGGVAPAYVLKSDKKIKLFTTKIYSEGYIDRVEERKQLDEISRVANNIKDEYGSPTSVVVLVANADKNMMITQEGENYVIDGIVIENVYIDLNDPMKVVENKMIEDVKHI